MLQTLPGPGSEGSKISLRESGSYRSGHEGMPLLSVSGCVEVVLRSRVELELPNAAGRQPGIYPA